jgi:aminoglycoside 6'-N-acetyltransferase I
MTIIRQINPSDTPEWLRMRLALWSQHSPAEHLREMQELQVDPSNAVFVAQREDSRLCGFLEAGQRRYADGCDTAPVGYIEGWYVDADQRQRGIGAQLVAMAESWARDRGLVEMASDCLIDNLTSISAHRSLGYQEMERLVHFCKRL